jgi:hypothetical protein
VVTVFTRTGVAKASVMMGENPVIVAGPYLLQALPDKPPIVRDGTGVPSLLLEGESGTPAPSGRSKKGARRGAAPVRRAKSSKGKA